MTTFWRASLHDGAPCMFNDKTLWMINAESADRISNLLETDNHRGWFLSGSDRFLQTSVEISALAQSWHLVSHLKMRLDAIAFGCLVS
jgi:hypothetical protein